MTDAAKGWLVLIGLVATGLIIGLVYKAYHKPPAPSPCYQTSRIVPYNYGGTVFYGRQTVCP